MHLCYYVHRFSGSFFVGVIANRFLERTWSELRLRFWLTVSVCFCYQAFRFELFLKFSKWKRISNLELSKTKITETIKLSCLESIWMTCTQLEPLNKCEIITDWSRDSCSQPTVTRTRLTVVWSSFINSRLTCITPYSWGDLGAHVDSDFIRLWGDSLHVDYAMPYGGGYLENLFWADIRVWDVRHKSGEDNDDDDYSEPGESCELMCGRK